MADETTRADEWLHGVLSDATLTAAATGGVFADVAPEGTAFPYVVHNFQGGHDVRGAGPTRIMVSGLWLVQGVDATQSYMGTLRTIADRIDALLQAASGAAGSDGVVFSCVREQPFRMPEVLEGGKQIRHLGGLYRILVQVP